VLAAELPATHNAIDAQAPAAACAPCRAARCPAQGRPRASVAGPDAVQERAENAHNGAPDAAWRANEQAPLRHGSRSHRHRPVARPAFTCLLSASGSPVARHFGKRCAFGNETDRSSMFVKQLIVLRSPSTSVRSFFGQPIKTISPDKRFSVNDKRGYVSPFLFWHHEHSRLRAFVPAGDGHEHRACHCIVGAVHRVRRGFFRGAAVSGSSCIEYRRAMPSSW
jgi:hypothetical protein